jgi:hypothetical protein
MPAERRRQHLQALRGLAEMQLFGRGNETAELVQFHQVRRSCQSRRRLYHFFV